MRSRAAALSFALVAAVTATGCRRSPFAPSADAATDAPTGTPSVGDAARETIEISIDAVVDAAPDDSPSDVSPADGAAPDAQSGDDTRADDAPAETHDADADADAGSDARPEDQPCGPLALSCAPFACDVALGTCKTHCVTSADCVTGRACNPAGLCGFKEDTICTSNAECASGFCAQGVCCATACTGVCQSCALPGSIGTCTPVWRGALDPTGVCGAGATCNGRGGCVPATCTIDSDCGQLYWCTGGRCVSCGATCASSADCAAGAVCNMRNLCTYCYPADAGTLP